MHRIRSRIVRHISPKVLAHRLLFWLGAIVIGLAVVLMIKVATLAEQWFTLITTVSPFLPLLICPLGLMLVAWLTARVFPGSEGSGIPQVIASLRRRDTSLNRRLLSLRIAPAKILLTFLGLLFGASIGREGPCVHVGSSIMYYLSRFGRFSRYELERGLIIAGGAAGLAAAFNTPLAGVVFAIEEISRSFEDRTSGTLLLGVIISGLVAVFFLGNYTYFGTTYESVPVNAFGVIAICGVVGGLFGGLFSRLLSTGSRYLSPFARSRPVVLAGVCGLVVAIFGLLSHGDTYGTGYQVAENLMQHAPEPRYAFPFLKLLATMVSYLSGIPGGIFSPSLATGAGFGSIIASWFPDVSSSAVVILGMVGYFCGVVQTPITAFVIVVEMTGNHDMLIPLMMTSLIAFPTSRLVCPRPIYRVLSQAFLDHRMTEGGKAERKQARRAAAAEAEAARSPDNTGPKLPDPEIVVGKTTREVSDPRGEGLE